MTTRVHHWGSSLAALVAARMHQPFAYGQQDCSLFAADCVLITTGADPAADLRGTYSTETEAALIVKNGGGLAAIAAARLGAEIAPRLAQVGDIAMCQVEGRDALVVVMGSHLLGPGKAGLVSLPVSAARKVWRCTRAD